LQGGINQTTGPNYQEGGVNYGWFDPLSILLAQLGPDDPTYQYWCHECGTQMPAQIIDLDQVATQQNLTYPCCDSEGLATVPNFTTITNTLCDCFMNNMFADYAQSYGATIAPQCGPLT
jgi:hypothetical protein